MREHVGRLGVGATDGGDFPTIASGVRTDFIYLTVWYILDKIDI
jgi:hypothetical protein